MTFSVKNKFVTFGGSSIVCDDDGGDLLKVQGKAFSPTRKKKIRDLDGNLLFTVRNKFFHLFRKSAFVYSKSGEKLLKITKKFWTNKFVVKNCDSNIDVEGDWIGWNLRVFDGDDQVGTITRNVALFRDSFRVETVSNEYAALLTAIVVAIDNIFDATKASRRS